MSVIFEVMSFVAFAILFFTALVFKLSDAENGSKGIHKHLLIMSFAVILFIPNMKQNWNAVKDNDAFVIMAVYALGVWFIFELLNVLFRLVPTVTLLNDALSRSKDMKRSVDKINIIMEDQLSSLSEKIEVASNAITVANRNQIDQMQTAMLDIKRSNKELTYALINTYSNLVNANVSIAILKDYENQVKNAGFEFIKDVDTPFDASIHISSHGSIKTLDQSLDRQVAKVVKVGLKTVHGEILDSAYVVRYHYSPEQVPEYKNS